MCVFLIKKRPKKISLRRETNDIFIANRNKFGDFFFVAVEWMSFRLYEKKKKFVSDFISINWDLKCTVL